MVIDHSAPSSAAAVLPHRPPSRRERRWPGPAIFLRPGWPLTLTVAWYPLWWLLGVADFVPLIAAAIMAAQLVKLRRISVQPGFGWWLLFLAWVAIGIFLLQVPAPNALVDHSSARYVTYAFRCGWYLAATIALIYVYNMRGRLSTQRILRAFGWLFVTVVLGGVAGTLAPNLDFPSAVEVLLPRHLTHVQYVHDLVHPVMAQRYSVSGVVHPRASAPFAYTNDWGLNYICLLPFFVISWLGRSGGWRRAAGPFVLALSVYPVIMTQNRGLWGALAIAAVVVAVRAWAFGRARLLVGLAALTAILVAVLVATPLGDTVTNRLANGYSDTGRVNLGQLTVDSALQKAPIVGFGSTRNVQGAFYSIAGGNTDQCSLCTPPALGTQGHFWLLIFSTGVGGALLYLGFIALQLFRAARRNTAIATLTLTVIVGHLATMFVYDTIGIALVTIFVAIGLLWRDRVDPADSGQPARATVRHDRRLGGYAAILRANAVLMVTCAVVGGLIGLGYAHTQPLEFSTVVNVAVPVEASYPNLAKFSPSLDTVADLVDAPAARTAIAAAGGNSISAKSSGVLITATPNSQVLHIQATARTPSVSAKVALAAAHAIDRRRLVIVRQTRTQALRTLRYQDAVIATLVTRIQALPHVRNGTVLATTRDEFQTQLIDDATTISEIEASPAARSAIIREPTEAVRSGAGQVAAWSGFAIGLVLAVIASFLRDAIGARVGRRCRHRTVAGVWVLARLSEPGHRAVDARELKAVAELLDALGVPCVLGVGDAAQTRAVSARLNRTLLNIRDRRPPPMDHVVLVAGPGSRVRDIARLRERLERRGASVFGLIIAGQFRPRFDRQGHPDRRTVGTPAVEPATRGN